MFLYHQYHRLHGPIFTRILSLHRSLMSQPEFRSLPKVWRQYQPVQAIGKCQKSSLEQLEQPSPFAEDYRIYQQNIDLDAFFGEEPKYEKVSDVCLLNDHFILVKMPPPVASPPPSKSRIPRCFKCNRGSKVSPIREESEEEKPSSEQSSCLQPWSSRKQDDIEVFDSNTRLTSTPSKKAATPAPVIVEQPHPTLQLKAIQSMAPGQLLPVSHGPLYWFLWPFRRRLDSRSKSKSPLAAVHKTYFVRWSKPPDTLWNGFGVHRAMEERKTELRRCRSAVF